MVPGLTPAPHLTINGQVIGKFPTILSRRHKIVFARRGDALSAPDAGDHLCSTMVASTMVGSVMGYGLKPNEIATWWMELAIPPTADVVTQWRACLDATEQAQADRFYFDEDRWTYAAAHWLVRNALASVDGLPAADWRFIAEKRGKPRIDPALSRVELAFNLSHTTGFVACAISTGVEVGIDVESLARKPADRDIAQRFFSPPEVAILRDAAPERQRETFFRFWTLKEAFIKATGEGLSRPLDSFSFALDPVAIAFHPPDADEARQWTFFEQRPTPRHLLAIAIRRPASQPTKLSIRAMPSAAQ
jgi:4'-phosphopantetheinyl transferase